MLRDEVFSKLSFGAPAAERDINIGLADYFVESETYNRLAAREKTIILGNRGTGKSALFKVLASRLKRTGTIVIELNPENYSYEMLCSILASEKQGAWAKHGAFSSAWKFLIFVQIMKELTKAGTALKTGDAAKIHNYLRDHHGFGDGPLSILVSYLKRIEGFKIGPYEAGIKTRELAKLYKLGEIEPLIPSIVQLCARKKVVVMIDELDKGWDNSEDARAFISGLFQASLSLNELTPNLTVYVSLRQELYDSIPALYEDAQKYRDVIEAIKWDESSLLAIAANRIKYSMPELQKLTDEECWNVIFAEVLQYRKARSFNYLVDRTLYRPRELILFCTEALEEGKNQQVFPIDYSVISRAELGYSNAREQDISAEYRFQYPGLQSIFEVFRGRSYNLERTEIEEICLMICTGEIKTDKSATWIVDQDPELLMDVLWRIGFLRAHAVGGLKALRRSGSSYLGPHQVSFLNLRTVNRFQIHPMFRSCLGMKEARDKGDESHD